MTSVERKRKTWILYKANSGDAEGWEERMLMPSQGLTDLLAEEWDWSGQLPQVGDHVREYTNLEEPGQGITHGRDGDWVVDEVLKFRSFDTQDRIVVCICVHSPIAAEWKKLKRRAPVNEILPVPAQGNDPEQDVSS